jgi:hypothetical protein
LSFEGGVEFNFNFRFVLFAVPLGVTGNTSDSGSEESWFEPRRGNWERRSRARHGAEEATEFAAPQLRFTLLRCSTWRGSQVVTATVC